MVDEYALDQVLAWYERIEREVLEFSERVLLTTENETLKAPSIDLMSYGRMRAS